MYSPQGLRTQKNVLILSSHNSEICTHHEVSELKRDVLSTRYQNSERRTNQEISEVLREIYVLTTRSHFDTHGLWLQLYGVGPILVYSVCDSVILGAKRTP